jgi:hypothetical protein
MAPYTYLACRSCQTRIAVNTPPRGVVPHPKCPGCKKFTMSIVDKGTSPTPPPAPPAPPGASRTEQWQAQAAALTDSFNVLYDGAGENHGQMVHYSVSENPAKAVVQIDYTVGSSNNRTIAFHNSLLSKSGQPKYWLVKPAFGGGATPFAWATLVMKDLPEGSVVTKPPKAPDAFNIVMPLGAHDFGLIHLLAGHLKDARNLMGTANPARSPEDEVYRTTQGVQKGIVDALSPRGLNAVALDEPPAGSWVFLGANDVKLVVRKQSSSDYSVTTMFKGGRLRNKDGVAWKRKGYAL